MTCEHEWSEQWWADGRCAICGRKREEARRRARGIRPLAETRVQILSLPRKAAAAAGQLTYAPVEPCQRGHSLRYTRSGSCVECGKAQSKRYYAANKRHLRKMQKRWVKANADYLTAKYKVRYQQQRIGQ